MEKKKKEEKKYKDLLLNELIKLKDKTFRFIFLIVDTKGYADGSLSYIYNTAYTLQELGYNVVMAYQEEVDETTNEDDFVGVSEWMGEKYGNLPHVNLSKGELTTSWADFVIIPELFSDFMRETKKTNLPSKRIILTQNYNLISEYLPAGIQWGEYGIYDCITTSQKQSEMVKELFPYMKNKIVEPFINPCFRPKVGLKDLKITLLTRDVKKLNRIVKNFIFKYPIYRWVTFEDVRNLSQEEAAEKVRDSAFSVWVDDDTMFGYSLLEAIKSDNLVIARVPDEIPEHLLDEDGNLIDCAIWFYNLNDVHKAIANAIKWWLEDVEIPELVENRKLFKDKFLKEDFKKSVDKVYGKYVDERISELEGIIDIINKKEKE